VEDPERQVIDVLTLNRAAATDESQKTEADVEQWPNILSSLASSVKRWLISDHDQSGIRKQ
jgi:hypothetical protein